MSDFSMKDQLSELEHSLNEAVAKGYTVTVRVTNKDVDTDFVTVLKSWSNNEELKCLKLDADNLIFLYEYDSFEQGSCSNTENKVYFNTNETVVTLIVRKTK